MRKDDLSPAVLDAIATAGFSVYQSIDPHWRTYAFFTDGQHIGYVQNDRLCGLSLGTVHRPCRQCGTGFGLGAPETMTREGLARAFALAPEWAGTEDRKAVRKWPDLAAFLAGHNGRLELVREAGA